MPLLLLPVLLLIVLWEKPSSPADLDASRTSFSFFLRASLQLCFKCPYLADADGRSICLLLLDGERAAKSLTREGLVDPVVAAFHDVAGEYREDLIFTISGTK